MVVVYPFFLSFLPCFNQRFTISISKWYRYQLLTLSFNIHYIDQSMKSWKHLSNIQIEYSIISDKFVRCRIVSDSTILSLLQILIRNVDVDVIDSASQLTKPQTNQIYPIPIILSILLISYNQYVHSHSNLYITTYVRTYVLYFC